MNFVKLRVVGVLAAIAATIWAFSIHDIATFRTPSLARIICFHLPCDFIGPVLVIYATVAGFMYLRTRKTKWAAHLAASFELATVVCLLIMATGIVFSYAQWGDWWQNDPRQTSFLVVCMLMIAGVALRTGISDPERRNRAQAAYSLAIFVPFMFLVFVFPHLPAVLKTSFHPSNTVIEGGISGEYWGGILAVLVAMIVILLDLFKQRVELEFWEEKGA